jgi:hypothetical protein
MPTIDIIVDGLTDQQISELENAETNGICSLADMRVWLDEEGY